MHAESRHLPIKEAKKTLEKTENVSNIAVNKSLPFLVGPSEPTPAGTLKLTGMDSALSALPMAALFVFERPVDQPAETIRKALSRALVLYCPIAGRLVTGDDGRDGLRLRVACTGEGVAFVAAAASCSLRDAMLFDSSRPAIALEELAATFPGMYMKEKDPPLMLMQVTEFACGGFVVGVTWNHAIADGAGMAQFLEAVGELACGLPSPTVLPVRWDYCLPELPPAIISSTQAMVSCEPHDYASSYITIPMSFISRVKAELSHRAPAATPCSLFEVVVAAIWQCRASATMSSDADVDDPVALVFTTNVTKQAQAKAGYYGNCFIFQMAVATRGEVANGDVVELVKLVKDAKGRIPHTFQMNGAANSHGGAGLLLDAVRVYDTLYVSSWWNLGFDDVDFGGGSATRVMYNVERKVVPSCFLCGRKEKDGVGAMAFCVDEEHAEAFHAELGRLW